MPVTIKDIAKAANVSHSTVSRALKGHPAISAETTRRIRQLADDMGYTPSAVAQSLLARHTHTIGMVVTTIADPFYVRVVEGVEQVAQEMDYSLFLSASHNNSDAELAVVETFHRRRVDAIIVSSSRVGSVYSSRLDRIKIPIVLINNQEEGDYLYSVSADDIQGARLATSHLIKQGHRRIAYVETAHRPRSNRRRGNGYRAALEEAGLTFQPTLVFPATRNNDFEQGQSALADILARGATAVFCYNDITAIGLMSACRRTGISVPADLSIIGFDDIDVAMYVTPNLTTIHQPRFQLGQQAMRMALNLLEGCTVQNRKLTCQLIVRESTATK